MSNLAVLRGLMKEKGIDAYLITDGDPHASEYVTAHWKARSWFSGFTGSNGLVVITQSKAGLWTDGRYFDQAEQQLCGTGIELYKMEALGVPKYDEFLAEELPKGGKLGFDGRIMDMKEFESLQDTLKKKDVSYSYQEDLVGLIWKDRPALPTASAFEHEQRFAGMPITEKLAIVRKKMAEEEVTAYLVSALDDIAWLMNIRGRDVPHTPVVYAYAFITPDEAHLFIDQNKITDITAKLKAQGITIHDYDSITGFLGKLSGGKLLFDTKRTNVLLSEALPKDLPTKQDLETDIVVMLKAVKSDVEVKNSRNAYIKESVVLVRFLKWLDQHPDVSSLTEGAIVRRLTEFRKQMPDFLEDGFASIIAYGENAAFPHYNPGPEGAFLKADGFMIVDTGGQYYDGTTDTTRTVRLGAVSDEMKRMFTLVLKGHIGIAKAVFPKGTAGVQLDILARLPLWEQGLDFLHGTGHGIGYCLGVHEGPQNISKRPSKITLEPGMFISNEPGFYKKGYYGIRIENIIVVEKRLNGEYGEFYGFDSLIYCPIDTSVVDVSLLNTDELEYLNEYHKKTFELVSPHLAADEKEWLKKATMPITKA